MKNIETLSIIVQWDSVDDSHPTTYTIIWTNEKNLFKVTTLIEQTSYTITGLTVDTVYTVTVIAANRCGNGPEFSTSVSFSADATSTTTTISPTVTASINPMTILTTAIPNSTITSSSIVTPNTSATIHI